MKIRKLFRKILKCKHLCGDYKSFGNYCTKTGGFDPDKYGQCKHCKDWE